LKTPYLAAGVALAAVMRARNSVREHVGGYFLR
jgi:hypothetical protein